MQTKTYAKEDTSPLNKRRTKPSDSQLTSPALVEVSPYAPILNAEHVLHLQRTIGNQATRRHLEAARRLSSSPGTDVVQRMSVFAARQATNKWTTLEGKVPYADLFGVWLLRPGNQAKLESMDESQLREMLEPMTAMTKEEVDKERIELSFQRDKESFVPTYGASPVFQTLVKGINPSDNPTGNLSK